MHTDPLSTLYAPPCTEPRRLAATSVLLALAEPFLPAAVPPPASRAAAGHAHAATPLAGMAEAARVAAAKVQELQKRVMGSSLMGGFGGFLARRRGPAEPAAAPPASKQPHEDAPHAPSGAAASSATAATAAVGGAGSAEPHAEKGGEGGGSGGGGGEADAGSSVAADFRSRLDHLALRSYTQLRDRWAARLGMWRGAPVPSRPAQGMRVQHLGAIATVVPRPAPVPHALDRSFKRSLASLLPYCVQQPTANCQLPTPTSRPTSDGGAPPPAASAAPASAFAAATAQAAPPGLRRGSFALEDPALGPWRQLCEVLGAHLAVLRAAKVPRILVRCLFAQVGVSRWRALH
jgi:hypothetical protein